jgi:sugar transferase (PEP-CTERM/EpsH1 system associated)
MHVVRTMATGGTEAGVRKLLSGLSKERFEQTICTLIEDPSSVIPTAIRGICLGRAPDKPAFLVPQLARIFARERPDIVHSRNWATIEAVIAAWVTRVPVVIHSEHGRDLGTMGPQPWRRRALRRFCYGRADRVFCVSHELREYYRQELRLTPTWPFRVIPNGVDTQRFCPNSEARRTIREMLRAGTNTLVVGTVSRLDPIKDHATLLAAAEMACERGLALQLIIVGEGVCRRMLEQALANRPALQGRAHMVGDVNNVADWLNGFDVFVLPSLSEGMSNTLLEAMAVGLPIIATAVGGNLEVVEHGISGLLVQPQRPEEICSKLEQLGSSAALREKLGQNARQRVLSCFSLDRMLKSYEQMYCELVTPDVLRCTALSRA